MNFRSETFEKIEKKVKPYHSLIVMLIFLVSGIIAVYQFVVKPPDLSIEIKKNEVNFPSSLSKKLDHLLRYLADSSKNDTAFENAGTLREYLVNTDYYWSITFKNETRLAIKSVNARIVNVSALNAWAVSSTYFSEKEKNAILQKISFEPQSGIIYLDKLDELPSKADLTIYVWGKLPTLSLDENIYVNYEGGSARIGKHLDVTGFKAYIVEYIYELFFILLLIFIAIYIRVVKKYTSANN